MTKQMRPYTHFERFRSVNNVKVDVYYQQLSNGLTEVCAVPEGGVFLPLTCDILKAQFLRELDSIRASMQDPDPLIHAGFRDLEIIFQIRPEAFREWVHRLANAVIDGELGLEDTWESEEGHFF